MYQHITFEPNTPPKNTPEVGQVWTYGGWANQATRRLVVITKVEGLTVNYQLVGPQDPSNFVGAADLSFFQRTATQFFGNINITNVPF